MKALTLHRHWAELVASGKKRVENRPWNTNFRGVLAIHAGKATGKIAREAAVKCGLDFDALAASAIVGTVEVVDCLTLAEAQQRRFAGDEFEWLPDHEYLLGPRCLVLRNARRLETPIPIAGKLGLWNLPEDVEQQITQQLRENAGVIRLLENPQMPRDLYRLLHAPGVDLYICWQFWIYSRIYDLTIVARRGERPGMVFAKSFDQFFIANFPAESSAAFWTFVRDVGQSINAHLAIDL